jgi:branched-chain amino acid transport system ATP-binding protein
VSPAAPLLEVRDLDVHYGRIHALRSVSLEVGEGEIATLIGANGAGKTTTLRTISGLLKPSGGEIRYRGEPIGGLAPDQIVRRGISQSPEGRKIFPNLTVQENLDLGAYIRRDKEGTKRDLERVFALFPRLHERRRQRGGTLSGGEQQMLAIGRALMSAPRLLLLDEPSLGLAPLLVEQIFKTIVEINKEGVTVLLVEQNAHMALRIARHGYVLETGRVTLKDDAARLAANEEVKKAYLGG